MSTRLCQVCNVETGKYSCPKCDVFYCSVNCYRSEKHLQCSELFYENCVKEELKDYDTDPEAKKKILEILKENQKMLESDSEESLDSDDEESTVDLATRMTNVSLDDEEAIWEKLTPEEKQEFKKLIATGNIIKILPEWEPWWKTVKQKSLIQDFEAEPVDFKTLCPAVPTAIPSLSDLTTSKPSPNIPFMVLNVLASYVFTVRWFKGCYDDMPVESISTFIALSASLRTKDVFKNSMEAFVTFEDDLSKCEWIKASDHDKCMVMEDLKDIINGINNDDPYFFVKASLNDMNSVTLKAISVLKGSKTHHLKRFSGPVSKISELRLISKKLTFYLSWTVVNGNLLKNSLDGFAQGTL